MPNIALVVLDTLRYDVFCREFDWLPGRRFTRAYAPSHWTIPVHGSLFTGRYASEIGVHGQSPSLDCPDPVLAERLSAEGYRTRQFNSNSQLERYDGWQRGFDEAIAYPSLNAYGESVFDWGSHFDRGPAGGYLDYLRAVGACVRSDCATVESLRRGFELYRRSSADGGAKSTLERVRATEFGDREFLFVNLMETHTPLHPPDGTTDPVVAVAADAFTGDLDLPQLRAAYETSATYLSAWYSDLFEALQSSFDYVITVADHGELLGEHGMVNHSFGLWPELTHVPLVVSGPGIEEMTDHRVVSLLDVHRTIADLAEIDIESRGRYLLDAMEPTEILLESHGLLPFHERQFERKGVPADEYRRRADELRGYVSTNGSYAHETHAGLSNHRRL